MTLISAQQEESSSPGGGSAYGQEESASTAEGAAAALAAATALEQGTLPPHWYVYTDTRGVFYYHNPYLNITQWERPSGTASLSSPKGGAASSSPTITTTEEEEACTLNLSLPERGIAAANVSRVAGEAAARDGRGAKTAAAAGRKSGSSRPSDGFLSLASSSPLDMRQRPQQQQQQPERLHHHAGAMPVAAAAAEHVYFSQLASDSTAASARLSHAYEGVPPAGDGKAGGSAAAAAGSKRSSSSEELYWLLRCCGVVNVYAALERLFAVTTEDIYHRLRFALLPWRKGGDSSRSNTEDGEAAELLKRPDMYGPFWVATTLVVLAFACSNFPLLLSPAAAAAAGAAADVRRLGQAAAAVYGCFLVPPLVVWAALQYYRPQRGGAAAANTETGSAAARAEREPVFDKSLPPALEQLLCLQGYAFTPLCLCCSILLLLQVFPTHTFITVLQWTAAGAAGTVAAVFLFQQLRQLLRAQPIHIRGCCFALLIGATLLLLLLLVRFAAVGCQQHQAAAAKPPTAAAAAPQRLSSSASQSAAAAAGDGGSPSASATHAALETSNSSSKDGSTFSLSDSTNSASSSTASVGKRDETATKLSRQQPSAALVHLQEGDSPSRANAAAAASPPASSLPKPADTTTATSSDREAAAHGEQLLEVHPVAAAGGEVEATSSP